MEIKVPNEIIEAYVFANTPAYLYRKLLASMHVSALEKLSKDNLSELVIRSTNGDVESVALAYSALLSLLRSGAPSSFIQELISKAKLNWANEIISLHQQKNTTINNVHFTNPFTSNVTIANYKSNSTSSNFVSYSPTNS
ncbi:hypothetical protein [Janthinobacterium sp. EB271-G4-7A]|uniref:hypothetical protein n=1 Tax=Janthinobacterium sp. EB271-G4-7A TaxID=2775056 RepID=UPI001E39044E|nr:hypothetical protein [Janthinobacterium sp. EB271-G4-7A]MCC7699073.1 hypothetical protein [Janthinobacterium sp. EB271-G4-7A]